MSKLHTKTKSNCMICDEIVSQNCEGILLHKTRRQTHILCLDCGIGYLKPLIEQSTNNIRKNIRKDVDLIKCPGSTNGHMRNMCQHPISLRNIKIPECDLSLDLFRLTYVLETYNSYICPDIKCGQVVQVDLNYNHSKLSCSGKCNVTWCRNCFVSPFHDEKSCIEDEAEAKNTENGKSIWDLKEKGKLKFCPCCRSACIKNNGCNKMICPSCNQKWCWLCLTLILIILTTIQIP